MEKLLGEKYAYAFSINALSSTWLVASTECASITMTIFIVTLSNFYQEVTLWNFLKFYQNFSIKHVLVEVQRLNSIDRLEFPTNTFKLIKHLSFLKIHFQIFNL